MATASFATYLAVVDMRPTFLGYDISPLALAFVVLLVLTFTRNMSREGFIQVFKRTPVITTLTALTLFAALVAIAVFSSDRAAMWICVSYYLSGAIRWAWKSAYGKDPELDPSPHWSASQPDYRSSITLEAAGIALCAMTLFTTWTFAGPLAFAAMMTFGMPVMRLLVSWIVMLYVLDAQARDRYSDPDD